MTGSLAAAAGADHYHTFNSIEHGMVQGDSPTDGSFFSRTYGRYLGYVNDCAVGDVSGGGTYASTYSYNGNLCSLWSRETIRTVDECQGFSYSRVRPYGATGGGDVLGGHYHFPHTARPSCKSYPV